MVMYSFSYFENGKKKSRKMSVSDNTEVFEGSGKKKLYELLISTPVINSLCTKAIKTEILKKDPTDYSVLKEKDIAEDSYIVSYFVTACKKIVSINDPLYNYRTNQKSISRSYNPQKIERKNMLFLYKRFFELLPTWEMDNNETRNKIYIACFDNAMYLFRKHYEYANNAKKRKTVLEYDWNSMLFEQIISNPQNYGNETNIKIYQMLTQKKYISLYLWFAKNKAYNLIKKLKQKIKGV